MKQVLLILVIQLTRTELNMYRTTVNSLTNLRRKLVKDTLFQNLLSKLGYINKSKVKQECNFQTKKLFIDEVDVSLRKSGNDKKEEIQFIQEFCPSIQTSCCTTNEFKELVIKIRSGLQFNQRVKYMINFSKFLSDLDNDQIDLYFEEELHVKEMCLYKEQTLDSVK